VPVVLQAWLQMFMLIGVKYLMKIYELMYEFCLYVCTYK
jgi:hypothetical protein